MGRTSRKADRTTQTVQARTADDKHRVLTFFVEGGSAWCDTPCTRCPWRRDAPPGEFPAEAFRHSARDAYDASMFMFGCHSSDRADPFICAGFLLRSSAHNTRVRMMLARGVDLTGIHSDVPLYDNYREMAIANGVDPDDPALAPCRDDAALHDHYDLEG